MNRVLAIDLGASSGTAILTSFNNNKIETIEVNRFENYVTHNQGQMRWNFPFIMEEILKSIKMAEEYGDYDSLAVDTWGVDFGLLDKNGELLEYPYHYRDERTKGSIQKIKNKVDLDFLYKKTGIQTMEMNTLFQLYVLKEEKPDLYNRAEHLLMMPDLINYYLTGEIKTERTIASTTQLYNPIIKNWDYELIKKLDIKTSLFSEIINPGHIVGNLKKSIVKDLKVSNKKVIAVGSHDTASAIVCTPENEKSLFLSSGTWSLIGTQLDEPNLSEAAYNHNLSNESGVNNKITLLKNITGLWLIQETKKQFEKDGKNYSFSDISQMAKKAKSINCYFDTDLAEMTVPGDIPKRIKLLAKKTNQDIPTTDGEIARVIYENLALKYRTAYEEIVEIVNHLFDEIHIVGGGANAHFLLQLTANLLNIEVNAGISEATAIGNSLVQMESIGLLDNLSEKENIIGNSFKITKFFPEEVEHWEKKYQLYKEYIKK